MESKPAAPALRAGPSPRPVAQAAEPAVRFSPYAWAKMLCLRDAGPSEVGGLGLCRDGQDPLAVHDVAIPRQLCSPTTTCLDDDAVNDHMTAMLAEGLQPFQTMRIWVHTHPGDSAEPSGTDWETFGRIFARADWGVMVILAMDGSATAHLRLARPVPTILRVPVRVDCRLPFPASDPDAWRAAYAAAVTAEGGPGWGGGEWGPAADPGARDDAWADLWGAQEPDAFEGYGPASLHRRQAAWARTLTALDDDRAQQLWDRLEARLAELAEARVDCEGDEDLLAELHCLGERLAEQLTQLKAGLRRRGWVIGGGTRPAALHESAADRTAG